MQDYEKLGAFYLGREYDMGTKQLQENLVLYDSRDLVTHAVVVGMTGSGKRALHFDRSQRRPDQPAVDLPIPARRGLSAVDQHG
jgi:hypothetical protein